MTSAAATGEGAAWIYHERQQQALCGQHALNNLLQANIFSREQLERTALTLDHQELALYGPPGSAAYNERLRQGSQHVDGSGNFSLQTLERALTELTPPIELSNSQNSDLRGIEPTDFEGFICHKEAHWFAIRKINGRFWNLNSFLPKPEVVSAFRLGTEIANLRTQNYIVFVALPLGWRENGKLPPVCTSESDLGRGKTKYWWSEPELVRGLRGGPGGGINTANKGNWSYENTKQEDVKDSANATQNPWLTAGSGQALGAIKGKDDSPVSVLPLSDYSDLTVEVDFDGSGLGKEELVKVQLKLPHNKKMRKVFRKTETVGYMHKVVWELCTVRPAGKTLQLSAGFPPKVLLDAAATMEKAGLAGASITCRWI